MSANNCFKHFIRMTFDERTIIATVVAYGWEMWTYNFVFLKIR